MPGRRIATITQNTAAAIPNRPASIALTLKPAAKHSLPNSAASPKAVADSMHNPMPSTARDGAAGCGRRRPDRVSSRVTGSP